MTGHEREGAGVHTRSGGSDEAVARAWREASDEAPSASLDATILAAARSTVATSAERVPARVADEVRASSRFRRWQPLAIAASVAGLAFVLAQTLPPPTEPARQGQVVAPDRASNADVASARTAPVPAPAPPAEAVAKSSAADQVRAPTGSGAAAEMSRERTSAEPRPDPPAWADRIAALHAAGDLDGAAASLRDFRAAHDRADEFLPVALRDWAGSVK
jgi:hypothetical protein